ncbi:MAG: carboxypeptidase-like regulatory domain-containing protein, partial [Bacteroidota bacterium]|nr:carboxypeptidase-like regulatory domain-containing protein [Bacteroidota bacterium]
MRTSGLLKVIQPVQNCLFLVLFFLLATTGFAQVGNGLKVTGKVIDIADNQGMPGVNIFIKGTQDGCITDVNGNYSITVPKNSILVFKMIGYETQEIKMENQLILNVTMKVAVTSLDEVVVIGYGTTTKKEITGSISTVKQDNLNQGTYNNPIALLQGKVAGLSIVNPDNADPMASYNIILRGTNTLTSGQGPLVIVDGVTDVDLKTISPEEIESIDVLKDGSAAAIYGTRGSNGVIIVTTKRAKAGVTKVEFSGQLSSQVAPRGVRNLSASEFKSSIGQYAPDKTADLYGADVNWFKQITTS